MPTIDDFIRPKEWVSPFFLELGKSIRQWGEEKLLPIRRKIDEDWQEHRLIKPLFKELLVDLGMQRGLFPAEVGGLDMREPATATMVLLEELSKVDCAFAMSAGCSTWGLVTILLEPHRNMELLREFGPRFCSEDELYMGCMAMTEPQGGSDIENMGRMHGRTIRTTATLDGDHWVINGHKIWPTNSNADLFTVVCTTSKGSSDPKDFALILVPRETQGVKVGSPYQKAGMAADFNADIWLEEVRVPRRYRLHDPGDDYKYFPRILSLGSVAHAAMAVGVMKDVYEIIKRWTDERVVTGKPLKEHSIVADMLCEIAILIESTSAWMWHYVRQLDHPEIYGTEPWDERMALKTRGISLYASEAVNRACYRAMDYMGSYGYAREFDIEKHWRDQRMIGLFMGGKGLRTLENARYWFDLETL